MVIVYEPCKTDTLPTNGRARAARHIFQNYNLTFHNSSVTAGAGVLGQNLRARLDAASCEGAADGTAGALVVLALWVVIV